jgi:hypothetical protein
MTTDTDVTTVMMNSDEVLARLRALPPEQAAAVLAVALGRLTQRTGQDLASFLHMADQAWALTQPVAPFGTLLFMQRGSPWAN